MSLPHPFQFAGTCSFPSTVVKRIKPFIGIVEHIRRDLSWSHSICLEEPVPCACSGFHDFALRDSGQKLAHALKIAMEMIATVLKQAYEPNRTSKRNALQCGDIASQKATISASVARTRQVLQNESHRFITHCGKLTGSSVCANDSKEGRQSDDLALFMTALLHVSHI